MSGEIKIRDLTMPGVETLIIKGQELAWVDNKDYLLFPSEDKIYFWLWLYKTDSGKYVLVRKTKWYDDREREGKYYATYENEDDLINSLLDWDKGTEVSDNLGKRLLEVAGFRIKDRRKVID